MSSVKKNDFEKLIIDSVNEGLSVLGESIRISTLYYLESNSGLSEEEIPQRPEVFQESLKKIFGSGVEIILRHIIQKLFAKVHFADSTIDKSKNLDFASAVRRARKAYEKESM
jgi:hypothetical protein